MVVGGGRGYKLRKVKELTTENAPARVGVIHRNGGLGRNNCCNLKDAVCERRTPWDRAQGEGFFYWGRGGREKGD